MLRLKQRPEPSDGQGPSVNVCGAPAVRRRRALPIHLGSVSPEGSADVMSMAVNE
jgi:hypothetical protein